jgi:hypothetical protein
MSTATNGAATEAAFKAITKATKDAGTAVVDAAASVGEASVGPSAEQASGKAKEVGQVWFEASKTITGLSLDAHDASVRAYLDYTESVAAACKAAWAIEPAQSNTKIVSGLAANYSNAARDLFNK